MINKLKRLAIKIDKFLQKYYNYDTRTTTEAGKELLKKLKAGIKRLLTTG